MIALEGEGQQRNRRWEGVKRKERKELENVSVKYIEKVNGIF